MGRPRGVVRISPRGAEAALRGFESYGERAAADIADTRRLIADIRGA